MNPDILDQLRGIHSAAEPAWFPPAPGWWIVLILILLAGFGLRRLIQKRKASRAGFKQAVSELDAQFAAYQAHGNKMSSLRAFSELTRRLARVRFPETNVATLHGQAWLQWLDETGETDEFTQGAGQVLERGLYAPEVDYDVDKLYELIKNWMRKIRHHD